MESAAKEFDVMRPRKVLPEKISPPSKAAHAAEIPGKTGGVGGGDGVFRYTVKLAYQLSGSLIFSTLSVSNRIPKNDLPASRVSIPPTNAFPSGVERPVPMNI